MRRASIALTLSLLLSTTAWVASSQETRAPEVRERVSTRGAVAVDDRLYCGLSISGGGSVSDAEVETFLVEVVEPRFPDGFTVWRARGAWMGGREETLVIEIAHASDPAANRMVREIGETYRQRFRQSAVLRVTVPAAVELITE